MTLRPLALALFSLAACGAPAVRAAGPQRAQAGIHVERILVAYRGAAGSSVTRTRDEALQRALDGARSLVPRDASIEEIAMQFGDQPPEGLAWCTAHDVQELSAQERSVALELVPGEVSAPVETPRGYVVMRRSRTDTDGSEPAALGTNSPSPPCPGRVVAICLQGNRVCDVDMNGCEQCSCAQATRERLALPPGLLPPRGYPSP